LADADAKTHSKSPLARAELRMHGAVHKHHVQANRLRTWRHRILCDSPSRQ
jgi:hypothetical protein